MPTWIIVSELVGSGNNHVHCLSVFLFFFFQDFHRKKDNGEITDEEREDLEE